MQSIRPRYGVLRPDSKLTLKHALQYYLEFEPDFVMTFFPDMLGRGYVSWGDVERLSRSQAESLAPMLADSIRFFGRRIRKERGSDEGFARPGKRDAVTMDELDRKSRLWSEALRDLCEVWGLDIPA